MYVIQMKDGKRMKASSIFFKEGLLWMDGVEKFNFLEGKWEEDMGLLGVPIDDVKYVAKE